MSRFPQIGMPFTLLCAQSSSEFTALIHGIAPAGQRLWVSHFLLYSYSPFRGLLGTCWTGQHAVDTRTGLDLTLLYASRFLGLRAVTCWHFRGPQSACFACYHTIKPWLSSSFCISVSLVTPSVIIFFRKVCFELILHPCC